MKIQMIVHAARDTTNSSTYLANTSTFGGLPDLIGDPNKVPGGESYHTWFNTAAFAVPANYTFGNARPNSLEAQHLYQTLLHYQERGNHRTSVSQLITQISNIFNHRNS